MEKKLLSACQFGNVDLVTDILRDSPDVDVNAGDGTNWSPLKLRKKKDQSFFSFFLSINSHFLRRLQTQNITICWVDLGLDASEGCGVNPGGALMPDAHVSQADSAPPFW